MRSRRLLALALAAGVALAGCSTPAGPVESPSPSASETVAAPDPVPAKLVISLDAVTVLNDDGTTAATSAFSDGAGVLALLGEYFGSTPEGVANTEGYPFTSYQWDGIWLTVVDDGPASIAVQVSDFADLAIETSDGIAVGSTRDEVEALDPFVGLPMDSDGDGQPDSLGLEYSMNPDVESLEQPGQPGTDFVLVVFDGDTVSGINAPSSDYGDL